MRREYSVRTGIHEQEAAGAVRVLRAARREAALPEEGRLLVARDAADRDARGDAAERGAAEVAGRRTDVGQHGRRNAEQLEQRFVPPSLMDVVEHRAGRVRPIGRVDRTAGQIPDKPGIDRAERQIAGLRGLPRAGRAVEDPFDLARREIGVGHKPRLGRDARADVGIGTELFDERSRATALPYDGVRDRKARPTVPDDRRLALVRDADGFDVRRVDACRNHDLGHNAQLARQDIVRIVLDPARLRIDLRKRMLGDSLDRAAMIEEDGSGRGCSLVERHDVRTCHCPALPIADASRAKRSHPRRPCPLRLRSGSRDAGPRRERDRHRAFRRVGILRRLRARPFPARPRDRPRRR